MVFRCSVVLKAVLREKPHHYKSTLHDLFPTTTSSKLSRRKPPTMAQMAAEERIALIKENLAETLDFDMIEKIINDGKDPKVYWGT